MFSSRLDRGDGPDAGFGSRAIGMRKPSPFAEVSDSCECAEFLLFWYEEDGNVKFSKVC